MILKPVSMVPLHDLPGTDSVVWQLTASDAAGKTYTIDFYVRKHYVGQVDTALKRLRPLTHGAEHQHRPGPSESLRDRPGQPPCENDDPFTGVQG